MKLGSLGLPQYRSFSLEEIEGATNKFDKSTLAQVSRPITRSVNSCLNNPFLRMILRPSFMSHVSSLYFIFNLWGICRSFGAQLLAQAAANKGISATNNVIS